MVLTPEEQENIRKTIVEKVQEEFGITGRLRTEIVERGFFLKGRPPMLPVETKRQRVNMLSAVSSQGKVRFMIQDTRWRLHKRWGL